MDLLVDVAADQEGVYFVMINDMSKLFQNKITGKCYVQLLLHRDFNKLPIDVVMDLAKMIDDYDIVEDKAYYA